MPAQTVTLIHPAIRSLLNGSGILRDLRARADRMVRAAQASPAAQRYPAYGASISAVSNHTDRARVTVRTTYPGGRLIEARDGVLRRAIDAGRG